MLMMKCFQILEATTMMTGVDVNDHTLGTDLYFPSRKGLVREMMIKLIVVGVFDLDHATIL